MREINAEQLRQMMEREVDLLVINVLSEEDFRNHHIPGSENIPIGEDDFVRKVAERAGRKDRTIVVYCASTDCDASPKAGRELEEAGFSDIYDFAGGMKEWEDANQPVETGAR